MRPGPVAQSCHRPRGNPDDCRLPRAGSPGCALRSVVTGSIVMTAQRSWRTPPMRRRHLTQPSSGNGVSSVASTKRFGRNRRAVVAHIPSLTKREPRVPTLCHAASNEGPAAIPSEAMPGHFNLPQCLRSHRLEGVTPQSRNAADIPVFPRTVHSSASASEGASNVDSMKR